MPETSEKILAQLGDGKVTEKPEILFQRLDINEVMERVAELHPPVVEEKADVIEVEPFAEEDVDFDTFCKSDFRAVKVKECSAVKNSKKLLHFVLDCCSQYQIKCSFDICV